MTVYIKKLFFFVIITALGCKNITNKKSENKPSINTISRDYVTVGRMMDSIQAPYIIDVKGINKRIVFIGCEHNNDSTHPQYKRIQQYARELRPQICFNEGGQVDDHLHYSNINDAIIKDGETGALKFYADELGVRMQNGDISLRTEWPITIKKHTKHELYLYYVMERFMVPFHYGAYGDKSFEKVFVDDAVPYLLKNGFPLDANEQRYEQFKALYKIHLQQDFDPTQPDLEAFDYINDQCKFCAVGRSSKMARDSMLLDKISAALQTNDRILVTFGHGHALALEPAIKQLIK